MTSYEARHSLLAALPIFVYVLGSDTSANRAVRAETHHFSVFQHFLARFWSNCALQALFDQSTKSPCSSFAKAWTF